MLKKFWLPSLEQIESKISKKTKAIIVVHIFGNVFNVSELKKEFQKKLKLLRIVLKLHLLN